MKKRFAIHFCVVLLAALLPLTMISSASADEMSGWCGDDLFWSFDETTGTLTITGSGDMWDFDQDTQPWKEQRDQYSKLILPDGLTTIGNYAFYGCTGLQSITIPDGVTSIGRYTFYGCTGLQSITIPDGVTSIGGGAFYNCAGLQSITIPDGVTKIGSNTFYGCTGLQSVTIGNGVTSIGRYSFYGCTGLQSVTIGNGVETIGGYAFKGCAGLQSITIPDGVTSIGEQAFYGCTGLTEITIPDSVTYIGESAFYNTGWWNAQSDGVVYFDYILLGVKGTCEEIVRIKDGTRVIASYAFSGKNLITKVTIPDSVTDIGNSAFYWCTGLQSVAIGNGVKTIDEYTFSECTGLTSITIPDGVTSIGSRAFRYCTGLQSVAIGNGVETIGEYAFEGCEGLTDVWYNGTKSQRDANLTIYDNNDCLLNATWHYTDGGDTVYLEINEENFPDEQFRDWVIENLPVSGNETDGYYMTEEQTLSVNMINCRGLGIRSVQGIEYFPNLRELVINYFWDEQTGETTYNAIEELDVSKNTALRLLYCGDNQLTSLDVSKNTALIYLDCEYNQLTSLDVSKNTALVYLCCNSNQLTALDVSRNPALISLWVNYNQLTALDVSQNTELENLFCAENQLTALDVSKNLALKSLTCNSNQLTDLDISLHALLEHLACSSNWLTSLDVSKNPKLKYLECNSNQLMTLDISQNIELRRVFCDNNQLTALDISKNPKLEYLECNRNQLTTLDVSQNSALVLLECVENQLPWLDLSQNADLSRFNLWGQNIYEQTGTVTETTYAYNLTQLVPKARLANVTLDDSAYQLNTSTGVVMFPSEVESFSYLYRTEKGGMDVTVHLTFESPKIEGVVEWNPEDVKFKGTTAYVIYNGKAQTPRFTVKNSADGSVIDPEFYDFEYRENTAAGTGYVLVTFKNAYAGTCRGSFKIYLPATTETSVENINEGIKVSWAPVEGAAGYVIYRRAWSTTTDGWTAFARWNNTTETTYIDGTDAAHKVFAGTRYQYGVKAYFARRTDPVTGAEIGGNVNEPSGNFNLGEVGPLKTTVRITTRTLNSVTAGTKQMTVKWTPSSVFTGYEIQYATNKTFTKDVKTVKITNASTTQKVIKSLTSGKTYYVRIRSYHNFNGVTYYGGWSNVKNCKVK